MMKTTATSAVRLALFAAAGAAACAWAPHAAADDAVPPTDLGMQADVGGGQQWTVTGLQPSADPIAAAAGSLWEATATSTPAQGGIPVVPGFAARTADGQNYPVLWNVPTPLGISPAPVPAGESTTGKLYFDVTGSAPDSVTYTRDGQDVAVWVQPPPAANAPAPATYGGAGTYLPPMPLAPVPVTVPQAQAAAAAPAAPAPAAAGSSGTPAPAAAGSSGTPAAAAGSAAPQPATGSVGTPATPATPATPNSTTATPAPMATTPAPVSTTPAAGTAPAAGTPAPVATTPAPAANTPMPTTGSSGTTFTAPTTTPMPAPVTAGQ